MLAVRDDPAVRVIRQKRPSSLSVIKIERAAETDDKVVGLEDFQHSLPEWREKAVKQRMRLGEDIAIGIPPLFSPVIRGNS